MKQKQLFFKTVRSNGDSVWAIGRFNKNYQVGKRYRFPKKFPAHVFLAEDNMVDSKTIYMMRREQRGGNRVMVCVGNLEQRNVPVYEIDENWNLNEAAEPAPRWVSTDFTVIGEILRPDDLPLTTESPKYNVKVVERVKSKKAKARRKAKR